MQIQDSPCPQNKIHIRLQAFHSMNCRFHQIPWGVTTVVAISPMFSSVWYTEVYLHFGSKDMLVTHVPSRSMFTVVGIIVDICDLPEVTWETNSAI